MKIIIPGARNEELIRELQEKKATLNEEEWAYYCDMRDDEGDTFFDALYYTCENGDEMLEEQADYFHDCLMWDERHYFAGRLGNYEPY